MRRISSLFTAVVLAGLVFFGLQIFKGGGFNGLSFGPGAGTNVSGTSATNVPLPAARTNDTIRIASFNIQVFGESKSSKPHVMDALVRICRQFDVIAIQEIRSKSNDILPHFIDLLNANGAQYDFVIGPRLGRTNSKEQYAVIYDRASVEVDRQQLYTVEDPDDLLHREPLVAWFRVRGPPARDAFTFSLVDIHTDPDEVKQEMNALDDVFRAVRDDGRGEDDVILLGDLNCDDRHLGELGQIPNIMAVIHNTATNTRGTSQYDNIIFDQTATREFTGRAGVFDFLREFNLSMEEALEISDHIPIWAEFSIYEGGAPGRFANRPGETRK
ncbi:MAG TPA: endonuclease/exonuclease/phosphatase family protein [Pirellulaceae bacterium]|nr:endonuclease/exonuclease/phosphatase family protein [Pirellulaceae bacterium]